MKLCRDSNGQVYPVEEAALFPSKANPLYFAVEHHHSVTCGLQVAALHRLNPRQDLMVSPYVAAVGHLDVLESVSKARGHYGF